MSEVCELALHSWVGGASQAMQNQAVEALERGAVLLCPQLPFEFQNQEQRYLSPEFVDPRHKNISYDVHTAELKGTKTPRDEHPELVTMMHRFAEHARGLVEQLLPAYAESLEQARTSYRPVQVEGRPSSYRKDDSRLHVDAFPSSPIGGKRILRVFSNVNPNNEARLWRLGEPFTSVAAKFLPGIRKPFPLEAKLLHWARATKTKRSAYDHYMMNIHNKMKADVDYQTSVEQIEFRFVPGATWMVFTDQASHAAMNGQYLLEQSFYLPVEAMVHPDQAPLRVLERSLGRSLL